MIEVEFLGTGTSQGIPIIGCSCKVCTSQNSKDNRLRSSVFVSVADTNIVIDTGPDFRYQMLRAQLKRLDAVLVSHEHKDHIGGLDDIRPFNYIQQSPVDIYAEERVCNAIRNEFYYAFVDNPYPGVPQMNLIEISEQSFRIGTVVIDPIRGLHGKLPVLGYRIGDFAYLTDMNYISDKELQKLFGVHTFVINCLRINSHYSHFNLEQALSIIGRVQPQQAFLTHISHDLGLYSNISKSLPKSVFIAFDQLKIQVPE